MSGPIRQQSARSNGPEAASASRTRALTMVQRYEQIHNVFRWAREQSAHSMISKPPTRTKDLQALQARLRSELPNSFPDLTLEPLSDEAGSVRSKARQIVDLSPTAVDFKAKDDIAFGSCVQACSLVAVVIGKIPGSQVAPKQRARLHGLLDAEALLALRAGNAWRQTIALIEQVLAEIAEAMQRSVRSDWANESGWRDIAEAASKICLHRETVADIAAKMLTSPRFARSLETADESHWGIFVYLKVLTLLFSKLFKVRCFIECYLPTPAGEITVVASSKQEVVEPPPRVFGKRFVGVGRLQGGPGILTRSIIVNDDPSEDTVTGFAVEESPGRYLTIPLACEIEEDARIGQLAFGFESPCDPVGVSPLWIALALCVSQRLGRRLGGRESRIPWWTTFTPVGGGGELEQRIRDVVESAIDDDTAVVNRLAFVVVTATCEIQRRDRRGRVEPVLDNWAQFATLRLARGQRIYKLEEARSFAFCQPELAREQWVRMRNREDFPPGRPIVAFLPDGRVAGRLATWAVMWRSDVLASARQRDGADAVVRLIRYQLDLVASNVVLLNEMQAAYERSDYKRAFAAARAIVEDDKLACGIGANEIVRFAMLKGDFRSARSYSEERLLRAPWDPEAKANFVLCLLALGEVDKARRELERLQPKLNVRRGHFATLGLLVACMKYLTETHRESPLERDRSVSAWLRLLAPDLDDELRDRFKRALSQAVDYVAGATTARPGELLDDLIAQFEASELATDGRVISWGEIAALHRIALALKSLVLSELVPRRTLRGKRGFASA